MRNVTIAAFCALASIAFTTPSWAQDKAQDISQQQLMVDRFAAQPMQLLDVRSSDEYQQGHIKGAMNISFDVLADHLEQLDKDRPIVVYCRSGRRAGKAIDTLLQNGFTQVYHLEGDMNGWQEQKLPQISQP
ncbi:rhodanese-like domain-containing protein [Pseudoalteromonas sp. SSDWG2]|uniref:rhodanese-like domain-containing protein n=1 Tax=Pseudoalteromonas sp. SSDWG2 TaxID=3139391 RepID=UPI003BA95506